MFQKELVLLKQYLVEEYVGYQDKKDIINKMDFSNIKDFYVDVTAQLNRLYDPHVRIIDKLNEKKVTILCKNIDERLFVDKSIHPEIERGDEIIEIGGLPISEIISKEKELLFDPNPKRYEWHYVLRKYENVKLANGTIKNVFLESSQELYDQDYIIEHREGYCFIKLLDFRDVNKLHETIKANVDVLQSNKKIIIDVRDNRGGSDFAYFPLLEYIFPANHELQIDYGLTFNYTKKYCDHMIAKVDKDLEKMDEGETKQSFKAYRQRMADNYAKGMVKFTDDIEPIILDGIADGIKVIVLANERCGSSGDNFVATVKESEFVTVIGRATKGMNDYANCGYLYLNEQYDLLCPYSRYNGLDYGESMALKGIAPDIEIQSTLEDFHKDVMLEKALELLEINL
ncbi:S41 family peptidase [Macrococcus capreoli]|uniref:S41 family peptidase n=1 Tax=Macrococcus capreoli TaxID=2982690 RepID=UPI003EE61BB8